MLKISYFQSGFFYPAYKIRFQNGFEVGFIFNIGLKGGVRTLGLGIRVRTLGLTVRVNG